MQASLQQISDLVSLDLELRYRAASDKVGIHKALGLGLVSLTKRAFNNPAMRPSAWPSKADGSPAKLRKSGTLAKSIRVVFVNEAGVVVGSDRKYAAIHQLGGQTKPHVIRPKNGRALFWPGARHPVAKINHPGSKIPARPYFPFYSDGRATPAALKMIEAVLRAKLDKPKA